jgi:hypothetical protein
MAGLEKLTIMDADAGGKKVLFEAQFNPTEMGWSKNIEWVDHNATGGDVPYSTFHRGIGEVMEFTLFFDTTDDPEKNVHTEYLSKIDTLGLINVDKHRPPLLDVYWGNMYLGQNVLVSSDYNFTMFNKQGLGTRATAKLVFKQIATFEQTKVLSGEQQSPDHTKVRVLRDGDSLQSLAHSEYEDVALWKILAEHNNIENPLKIPAGTVIEIPALEN